jgi:RNA polymerase sigma factor (sigma-70 family)
VNTFRPWVHTVMRNRCLMLLRKQQPDAPFADQVETVQEPEEDAVLHEATLQRLESAITELKEGQRECIRLFYLERNSYQQTAQRTGLSVELVRSHLQNGRRNLRLLLIGSRPEGR